LPLLTAQVNLFYVKESESVIGVGNCGKVGKFWKLGVGIEHFASDSATMVKSKIRLILCLPGVFGSNIIFWLVHIAFLKKFHWQL